MPTPGRAFHQFLLKDFGGVESYCREGLASRKPAGMNPDPLYNTRSIDPTAEIGRKRRSENLARAFLRWKVGLNCTFPTSAFPVIYCTCSPGNIGRGFSVSGFAFKGSATTDFQRPPTHFVRVARWGLPTLYVRWVEVFQAEKNRTRMRLDLAACSKGSHMHSAMIDRLVPDRE